MRALVLWGLILLAGSSAGPAPDPSLIREERTVTVGGVTEQWRLVWHAQPQPDCDVASGAGWDSCPCDGFAFGETGKLDLVRLRAGREFDRLALTPFFAPYFVGDAQVPPRVQLVRYPVQNDDHEAAAELDSDAFEAAVHGRPPVTIMELRDYDRDGQATEFFLQTWAQACGHQVGIVVGVSRRDPKLHAFGSTEHPDQPLRLQRAHWLDLAQAHDPVTRVEWECGDHGSDVQTVVVLRAKAGEIHVTRRDYECKKVL
jgi:hypothetical protein